jgi:hypothetical protein
MKTWVDENNLPIIEINGNNRTYTTIRTTIGAASGKPNIWHLVYSFLYSNPRMRKITGREVYERLIHKLLDMGLREVCCSIKKTRVESIKSELNGSWDDRSSKFYHPRYNIFEQEKERSVQNTKDLTEYKKELLAMAEERISEFVIREHEEVNRLIGLYKIALEDVKLEEQAIRDSADKRIKVLRERKLKELTEIGVRV